jgi:hypothetical protein
MDKVLKASTHKRKNQNIYKKIEQIQTQYFLQCLLFQQKKKIENK